MATKTTKKTPKKKSYKAIQADYRDRLAPKLIYAGGTLNLSIKKFKRTTPNFSTLKDYKDNAWGIVKKHEQIQS